MYAYAMQPMRFAVQNTDRCRHLAKQLVNFVFNLISCLPGLVLKTMDQRYPTLVKRSIVLARPAMPAAFLFC